MSTYDALHQARHQINEAERQLQQACDHLDGINPDGGTEPVAITPTRFEDAYRALSRARTNGGHDYYDQWTPAGQRSHRRYARAVLEGAGFTVKEDQ